MDHSYSTEREKVQKTDHSYFTVAKKTPKVVLRRALMMKEHPALNALSSIGQDHSYVRIDRLLRLTDLINDKLYVDDECDAGNDDDDDIIISKNTTGLPQSSAQVLLEKVSEVLDASDAIPSSSSEMPEPSGSTDSMLTSRLTGSCDLDTSDNQISDIRLDHAYDLKLDLIHHRRPVSSSLRSKPIDHPDVVPFREQLSSMRLHDHTYLRRSNAQLTD